MNFKISSELDKQILKIYQGTLHYYLRKDPLLLECIRVLLTEKPPLRIDPKIAQTQSHIEVLLDQVIAKEFKDHPEMIKFFESHRGAELSDLVQQFASDIKKEGFLFSELEYNQDRTEESHLQWLEQQSFFALDPPLTRKKGEKVVLPLALVFDQFRNDFNFIIKVFFKPYIKEILKLDPTEMHYKQIFTEIMTEQDSIWNTLSIEKFSLIRNSIVRNHFRFLPNKNIEFFTLRKRLEKKGKLEISQQECLELAIILNLSVWLLLVTWFQRTDISLDNTLPDLEDSIKEIVTFWKENEELSNRLKYFSKTRFGRALLNGKFKVDLAEGRYSREINSRINLHYLKESITYFLGHRGKNLNNLFWHSTQAANRILYLNFYNIFWPEYFLPIGLWLHNKQNKTKATYIEMWKTFMDYSEGKYREIFESFSPIIRNALVHAEYYVENQATYILHSADYPDYSPITTNLKGISLFRYKLFFDKYWHPNIQKTFETLGLAKSWLEILEGEKKEAKFWLNEAKKFEELGYDVLSVLLRVKYISAKFAGHPAEIIEGDLTQLFTNKSMTTNEGNLVALVITALYLNNTGEEYLPQLVEHLNQHVDTFFDFLPKIKILICQMLVFLYKKRKSWKKAKEFEKTIQRIRKRYYSLGTN